MSKDVDQDLVYYLDKRRYSQAQNLIKRKYANTYIYQHLINLLRAQGIKFDHQPYQNIHKRWSQQLRMSSREQYFNIIGAPVFLIGMKWLEKYNNFKNYRRQWPGPIYNIQLLDLQKHVLRGNQKSHFNYVLKDNLQQQKDYKKVSKSHWSYICKIFGGIQVKRYVIMSDINQSSIQLYPQQLQLQISGRQCNMLASKRQYLDNFNTRLSKIMGFQCGIVAKQKNMSNKKFIELQSQSSVYQSGLTNYIILVSNQYKLKNPQCHYCGTKNKNMPLCECKTINYCNTHCQQKDQDTHLQKCKTFKQIQQKKLQFLMKLQIAPIRKSASKFGLRNLGNTCYMNSALQTLICVKQLTDYFLKNDFLDHINTTNPLGMTLAYGQLIRKIRSSSQGKIIVPNQFHKTLCKYGVQFRGYDQQDSHEFLQFLINALHQDLNLVKKKPYIQQKDIDLPTQAKALEAWNYYKSRNQSIITQIMVGQYITNIKCPIQKCGKQSKVFDPFIVMPLPISGPLVIRFYQVISPPQVCNLRTIKYQKGLTVKMLANKLQQKNLGHSAIIYEFGQKQMKIQEVNSSELLNNKKVYIAFLNNMKGYKESEAKNLRINLKNIKQVYNSYDRIIIIKLGDTYNDLVNILDKRFKKRFFQSNASYKFYQNKKFKQKIQPIYSYLNQPIKTITVQYNIRAKLNFYQDKSQTFDSKQLTLQKCLQDFQYQQVLDRQNNWFCPSCKQLRQASMSTRIYKLPSIFIITLKRFKNRRFYAATKNLSFVAYPQHINFDPYVVSKEKLPLKYQLFGVVNHMGTISRGHYTAHCKLEDGWYEISDSQIRKIQIQRVISPSAYILFYKRTKQ